ncbi:MAG TPA: M3 family oligoendopeptidase [Candidatus Methanoperedens sp.]|nr:M3 family oligoendopeptidase [Candidatus Methanoperedens sp.]HLB71161.1 M3 family oligoendopeptidase [Candidatus Methanoperedens sp.]
MKEKSGSEDVIWDLTHLYEDTSDKNIENDIAVIKNKVALFSTKYRGKLKNISSDEFLDAITEYEEIYQKTTRLASFAYLNFATQSNNAEASAFLQRFQEISSQFEKDLVFFDLEWASLEDRIAQPILDNPVIHKYRHYLQKLRKYRPHHLEEIEEKLLAEISPTGIGSWIKLFEKVLSRIKFGRESRTQEEVLSDLYSPDRQIRIKAAEDFTEGLSSQLHILNHIFNTILADKMITDRLRKYPEWISSMNLDNEIDEKVVAALVDAVKSRYDIPQRYYRLKKRLLGLDELFDYDRYAPLPISSEKMIPWNEGKRIVLSAYNDFSPDMADVARKFFEGRWIHAPVIQDKRGGAFSDPCTPDVHPYVMVNYSGNNRDVQTLAHELGHGVHQYLAGRKQGYLNSRTPLTMAETASVFGEMLVFRSLLDRAEGREEKLSLLCNKLEEIFATVFRQIAMNRFEDAVHNERRSTGELSSGLFGEIWIGTQKELFRDSITLTGNYNIWWSYISHFLEAPGYVYAYAFGELLVLSLYKRFAEEGESFAPRYLNLLASGGKDAPAKLLEDFGIKLNDPGFWQEGLEIIDEMLKQAEGYSSGTDGAAGSIGK